MKVKELTGHLESLFPLNIQEEYDNSGAQVVFGEEIIKGILISLDCTAGIVREAVDNESNCIITHHPFIFRPFRRLESGDPKSDVIFDLVNNRISLYAVHTNLDKIYSHRFAELLGLEDSGVLVQTDYIEDPDRQVIGFGVYGILPEVAELKKFMALLKDKLGLDFIVYSGNEGKRISRVALINGSAGRMLEEIISKHRPDCIVTGDVGYHHSRIAMDYGVSVIDAGHYGTERILLDFLKAEIQDYLTKSDDGTAMRPVISVTEHNPFRIFT